MSAPDPRMPDANQKPLSWFAPKKRNGRKPEEQAADDAIERLRQQDAEEWDVEQLGDAEPAPSPAKISHLDEIARLLRGLTYGEMCELASALWKIADEMEADVPKIRPTNIADVLHQWSNKHGNS